MRPYLTTLCLLVLFGCTKKQSDPNSTTRDIAGTVAVYDEFGVASNDVTGVTVTLSNGTTNLTTQTIQNGEYNFNQVPYGNYTLSVSRQGYGTNKRFGIQHSHPADSANFPLQLSPISISQLATTTVTWFNASATPNGAFDFWVSISPATAVNQTPRHFRIFAGLDSLVAWNRFDMCTSSISVTGSGTSGNLQQGLQPSVFPSGTKAWIRMYGDAAPNIMYYDSTTSQYVFPCLNPTTQPAVSIIVQ